MAVSHRVRSIVVASFVLAGVTGGACSGGGSGTGGSGGFASPVEAETICALVERMATSADPLIDLGPADPEEFATALDSAVLDLVSTLDALHEVVPGDIADDVEEMRGLVEQHRFQDAIEARTSLDEYARRNCTAAETSS